LLIKTVFGSNGLLINLHHLVSAKISHFEAFRAKRARPYLTTLLLLMEIPVRTAGA
jgi:hypothetical protein